MENNENRILINKKIAEFLGLKVVREHKSIVWVKHNDLETVLTIFNPYTNGIQAFLAVDKMIKLKFFFELYCDDVYDKDDEPWLAKLIEFETEEEFHSFANKPAAAISETVCKAINYIESNKK